MRTKFTEMPHKLARKSFIIIITILDEKGKLIELMKIDK